MSSNQFQSKIDIPYEFQQNFSRIYKQNSKILEYVKQQEKSQTHSNLNINTDFQLNAHSLQNQKFYEDENSNEISSDINPDTTIILDHEFRYYRYEFYS